MFAPMWYTGGGGGGEPRAMTGFFMYLFSWDAVRLRVPPRRPLLLPAPLLRDDGCPLGVVLRPSSPQTRLISFHCRSSSPQAIRDCFPRLPRGRSVYVVVTSPTATFTVLVDGDEYSNLGYGAVLLSARLSAVFAAQLPALTNSLPPSPLHPPSSA